MAVYNVTNGTELQSAITNAVGGDKIILADGNYGSVFIRKNAGSTITIKAANPGTGVHFDSLSIVGSKNLSFSGIDVGRALAAGEPEWVQLTSVRDSSNIKMDSMKFHGSFDGEPANDGVLLQVSYTSGFSVTNSHFTEGYRGVVLDMSSNLTVKNNELTLLRSDGVISAASDGVMIDGNVFTNFHAVEGDHSDAIQLFNTGRTKGSSNITIQNNILMQTYFSGVENTGSQGIWITDGQEFGFQNVLVRNNLLYSNDQWNGLAVAGGTNVQIIGNTLLSKPTDDKTFWIRLENDHNIVVKDNVAENILSQDMTDFFLSGNLNLAVDPAARARFGNLLNPASIHDLIIPGVGYQVPSATPEAPVANALASDIGNAVSTGQSVSVSSMLVSSIAETVANSSNGSLGFAPPASLSGADPAHPAFYDGSAARPAATAHLHFDSFFALP